MSWLGISQKNQICNQKQKSLGNPVESEPLKVLHSETKIDESCKLGIGMCVTKGLPSLRNKCERCCSPQISVYWRNGCSAHSRIAESEAGNIVIHLRSPHLHPFSGTVDLALRSHFMCNFNWS